MKETARATVQAIFLCTVQHFTLQSTFYTVYRLVEKAFKFLGVAWGGVRSNIKIAYEQFLMPKSEVFAGKSSKLKNDAHKQIHYFHLFLVTSILH